MARLDFTKIGQQSKVDQITIPRDIFSVLPGKATHFDYPRDVQTDVWKKWYSHRTQRDLVLKMNTGSGKTTVGLILLKSCLNESVGPAVYVAPNNFLAQQVIEEANALGIEVVDSEESPQFLRGKAIFVTNIHKIFNGKSKFGVAPDLKIQIGSVIIDDAHACLATVEDQFTLKIMAELYKELLNLFYSDLESQSQTAAIAIKEGEYSKTIQLPFWAWRDKLNIVTQLLYEAREEDELKFRYPLLGEHLELCNVVFGGGAVEISLRCLPSDAIPAFNQAKRRIFMTATLADDSILVTHFAANPKEVKNPVTPDSAGDIGDRMILMPQAINPELTEDDLRAFVISLAQEQNVVVLVPSNRRADYWREDADLVLEGDSLVEGIQKLRDGHVGLAVLVNRYDGIDLPNDACRVLVIDELPKFRRRIDQIDQVSLREGDAFLGRQMQRIEQGMGRGIRSNKDYCVVLLMGKSLTDHIYKPGSSAHFTPTTQRQMEFSNSIADQAQGSDLAALKEVMKYCLSQEPGYVTASREHLLGTEYQNTETLSEVALSQRRAFDSAVRKDYSGAEKALQSVVDKKTDMILRGWLKQQLAEFQWFLDPVEAQKTLGSAVQDNPGVLHPIEGVVYRRLDQLTVKQARTSLNYLKTLGEGPDVKVRSHGILTHLAFFEDTAEEFEEAVEKLGSLLGFNSQRPDSLYRRGPDNLWAVDLQRYFVIECKNGVTSKAISKHDAGQLTTAINWFGETYDANLKALPILIHPVKKLDYHASPHPDMRILTKQGLKDLVASVERYVSAAVKPDNWDRVEKIAGLLKVHNLTSEKIIQQYTEAYTRVAK